MSYEFYKVLHIVSLIVMVACFGLTFIADVPKKWARISGMVASFILFVAGFGLLARTKVGWPGWVITKTVIWLVVAVSIPVLSKRMQNNKEMAFLGIVFLLATAAFMAIMQPF